MKKSFTLIATIIITLFFLSSTLAQDDSREVTKYTWLAKNSWSFGFGGTYPYSINGNYKYGENGFGGFLDIQKHFSEHIGLRLRGFYFQLKGKVTNGGTKNIEVTSNNFGGDIEMLYYFVPCEPISPYINIGFGYLFSQYTNQQPPTIKDQNSDWQVNFGFGAEWTLSDNWKLKSELGYHTVSNASQEGVSGVSAGGLLGSINDAYMNFDLGFVYYFGYGERSNICDLYEGIGKVDYDKIEDIVRKYATEPTEVDYNRIEDIVVKHKSVSKTQDRWVLLGINFDFNKTTVRPESIPVLYHGAEILLENPNINVEIQGHTDNIGSESYNQKLSKQRAESVKQFLVAKGIDASRLTTKGFGESMPVADNKTAQGRELNRRIEFKVIR